MDTQLPAPIAAYIKAVNEFDSEALLATFTDDALVNDVHREFWGIDAIKKWSDREIISDRVTMEMTKVTEHYGSIIVAANMDGNYDKTGLPDPLVLTFYFSLHGDKIAQLIILHNTPAG